MQPFNPLTLNCDILPLTFLFTSKLYPQTEFNKTGSRLKPDTVSTSWLKMKCHFSYLITLIQKELAGTLGLLFSFTEVQDSHLSEIIWSQKIVHVEV